jgi:hypothetical protein
VIDRMTLAEAGEVFAYWEENPPAHLMVQTIARLLGWTPRLADDNAVSGAGVAAAPPPGLAIARDGDLGMPAPALEAETMRERNRARLREIALGQPRQHAG